jgi:hypothetical protein
MEGLLVLCATDKFRVVTGAMNDSFVLSQSHTLTNDLHSDFRSFLSCLKNNQASSCGFARITTLDSDQRQLEAASATFLFGKAPHRCISLPNIILFERILIPLKDNFAHIHKYQGKTVSRLSFGHVTPERHKICIHSRCVPKYRVQDAELNGVSRVQQYWIHVIHKIDSGPLTPPY